MIYWWRVSPNCVVSVWLKVLTYPKQTFSSAFPLLESLNTFLIFLHFTRGLDSNELQDTQERSSQDKRRDLEQGTFIGSPIWSYDCGPTLPISDHFSSLSNVEAQTFPSIDAAMTMHRREREVQEKAELKQGQEHEQTVLSSDAKGRGQEASSEGVIDVLASQQTEILGDDNHHLVQQPQPPPTISQLQRLLSIRKANSPAPLLRQEPETPRDCTPLYGDYQESSNGVVIN